MIREYGLKKINSNHFYPTMGGSCICDHSHFFSAMFNDDFGAINRDIIIPLIGGDGIPWLSEPIYARTAVILIQTWLGFPFIFALFTGVLQSISKDWYEAADVDGGTRFQKFRYITFPHVMFATAPLLIMQYAQNFNNFNIIYLFNEGGPPVRNQNAGGTDILISWVYKLTFDTNNYAMAAVISLIMGLIISGFAFYQLDKRNHLKKKVKFNESEAKIDCRTNLYVSRYHPNIDHYFLSIDLDNWHVTKSRE